MRLESCCFFLFVHKAVRYRRDCIMITMTIEMSFSSEGFWSDDDLGIQWDDGSLWVKAGYFW